ncbi:MOSC domain-containing protein [soil metagenome]
MTSPRVFSIQLSPGGVPKLAVRNARVEYGGIAGDGVNHPKVHGGPDRAVCLFPLEHILALQAEGHPIFPGSIGENLTLAGLDWASLEPGSILRVGDNVVLELTKPVDPCKTIAASFADGNFRRIDPARRSDWSRFYARVVVPGDIVVGDSVALEATSPLSAA